MIHGAPYPGETEDKMSQINSGALFTTDILLLGGMRSHHTAHGIDHRLADIPYRLLNAHAVKVGWPAHSASKHPSRFIHEKSPCPGTATVHAQNISHMYAPRLDMMYIPLRSKKIG
jgi:hypothetical protein